LGILKKRTSHQVKIKGTSLTLTSSKVTFWRTVPLLENKEKPSLKERKTRSDHRQLGRAHLNKNINYISKLHCRKVLFSANLCCKISILARKLGTVCFEVGNPFFMVNWP